MVAVDGAALSEQENAPCVQLRDAIGAPVETNDTLKKAGLAAIILLAPGGFILGATLAARYWQKRNAEKADIDPQGDADPETGAGEPPPS
uniref:hypothetical protein n=1 Tax=Sphingomonas sp. TaxID=28214 RepID=UPI0025FF04E6|nr:hypothetical protein [Sphingomonas sp.]